MKHRTSKAEREARAQIARTHPFVPCAECDNGWVWLLNDVPYGYLMAERCRCWYAHAAKVNKLIGGKQERGSAA